MRADHTFATRLLHFISNVQPACMAGDEEKEYLIYSAKKLIENQCYRDDIEEWEFDYLTRQNEWLMSN